jgi:hypothetical protein
MFEARRPTLIVRSEIRSDFNISIKSRADEHQEDGEKIPNPLHWFGVLVPAPLRDAQVHFVSVVDQPLAELANSARRIKQLEVQIERLRDTIQQLANSTNPIVSPAQTST